MVKEFVVVRLITAGFCSDVDDWIKTCPAVRKVYRSRRHIIVQVEYEDKPSFEDWFFELTRQLGVTDVHSYIVESEWDSHQEQLQEAKRSRRSIEDTLPV